MKTKCAVCGKTRKVLYEFKYLDYVFGYIWHICHDCGEDVHDAIQSLSESAKKEGKE